MKVWLLVIHDYGNGDEHYITEQAVFSTKEKAETYLANWCKTITTEQKLIDWFNEEPSTPEEWINAYFEFWDGEQSYDLTETVVDLTESD